MSTLTTRQRSIVIGSASGLASGVPLLIHDDPKLVDSGWDTLTATYLIRQPTLTATELAAFFPVGSQLGGQKFWVQGRQREQLAAGWWRAQIDYKGWAGTKPNKISTGSSADSQTAENVGGVPGATGTVEKIQTHENMPTIAVERLVENISLNSITDEVGRPKTPPVTISVAASVWATLSPFLYHWPYGWVLMGSAEDRLPGTNVALVTDTYQYIRQATPG